MRFFVRMFHKDEDANGVKCDFKQVADFIKLHPEDSYRMAYYSSDADESLLYGPMAITFAVRRAEDILLEPCEYAQTSISIEAMGRRIAQLPGPDELKKLLSSEECLIDINSRQYKPLTEVYGFGQVYDDSVKCLEALKNLKIPSEAIMVFATPEEITLEIHPKALGLDGCKNLAEQYSRLLFNVCEIKKVNSRLQKNSIKTVMLDSCENKRVIMPGSVISRLHRAKVNVGASHFAYGPAAFSDFCGKRRTISECAAEAANWASFIEKPITPVEGLAKKISAMPLLLDNGRLEAKEQKTTGIGPQIALSGVFQPLKKEIDAVAESFNKPLNRLKAFSNELNKLLCGGFARQSLNIVVGPRGSGKASFLLEQALLAQKTAPVLYMSFERTLNEFAVQLAAKKGLVSCPDLLMQASRGGEALEKAKQFFMQASSKLKASITDNLFFSPIDCASGGFSVEDALSRALMMPEAETRLIIIEKAPSSMLLCSERAKLKQLYAAAKKNNLTIIVSVEQEIGANQRPIFINEADRAILNSYLPFADTIIAAGAERSNLRRFAALLKGSVDEKAVEALEQRVNELSGKKRLKSDTYSFFRVIKNNQGRNGLLLYLFQPDIARLIEVAAMQITLP